jgi:hypothetical protein
MKPVIFLALGMLAGCGGSGNDGGMASGPAAPSAPTMTAAEKFFSSVAGVASWSENDEPVAVETVAAAESDDTEPQPVK